MKIHVKKKRYQAHCREQVKQGYINDQAGHWIPAKRINAIHAQMAADMKAGYKL